MSAVLYVKNIWNVVETISDLYSVKKLLPASIGNGVIRCYLQGEKDQNGILSRWQQDV